MYKVFTLTCYQHVYVMFSDLTHLLTHAQPRSPTAQAPGKLARSPRQPSLLLTAAQRREALHPPHSPHLAANAWLARGGRLAWPSPGYCTRPKSAAPQTAPPPREARSRGATTWRCRRPT